MKYVLLDKKRNAIAQIIPEEDPKFPSIPLSKRYSTVFISQLMPIADDLEIEVNWLYDNTMSIFTKPKEEGSDEDIDTQFIENVNDK